MKMIAGIAALLAASGGQEKEPLKQAREKALAQARAEGRPLIFVIFDTA